MSNSSRVWISVSDMMTGLMMVFLFVSVLFMTQVRLEQQAVQDIAVTHEQYQEALYRSLVQEFQDELSLWNAQILADTTVRFNEPEVLFNVGSRDIKPQFARILDNFFPRYVALLTRPEFQDHIDEIRIEGHTSSSWDGAGSLEVRYLNNALLSQQRSFAILEYVFKLRAIEEHRHWLTSVIRANGLAFANPVLTNGAEDPILSRRVEFKVKTKAEEKITEIIQTIRGRERAS